VWDFSRTPTIPNDVREEWTRSSAGRVLNAQGRYVSRGSDVPRLSFDGDEPGLLVEASGRTNVVTNSSDITLYGTANLSSTSSKESIIEGGSALQGTGNGTSAGARFRKTPGTLSSGEEVAHVLIEQSTSDKVALRVFEKDNFNLIARALYEFSSDSILDEDGISANRRVITPSGPNGGTLIQLQVLYDPTSGTDFSGNARDMRIRVDPDANGSASILHHAQIEEAPNASSPIVTSGSAKTRAADDYAIQQGDWVNPNEQTIITEFVHLAYTRPFSLFALSDRESNFIIQSGSAPFNVVFKDSGGNKFSIQDAISPFTAHTIATSSTASGFRASIDGTSKSISSHNGDRLWRQNDTVDLMSFGRVGLLIKRITYFPRALPESTLNTLTS